MDIVPHGEGTIEFYARGSQIKDQRSTTYCQIAMPIISSSRGCVAENALVYLLVPRLFERGVFLDVASKHYFSSSLPA
jgi:hypothetical protein